MFSDPSISISEFNNSQLTGTNLMFVGEMEFDGLFGYSTVSTKLLRRFGKEQMLHAYEKKIGNLPHPGEDLSTIEVAKKFTDGFEISSLEVVANSSGIVDVSAGHPSSTMDTLKISVFCNDKRCRKTQDTVYQHWQGSK
ncbi:hypothetical protein [Candidatus Nitrosotalea sp. TS]|uniref:hypothetical protein n=1 Tax=Candidatus Nitrosotalea sp. TS TaxID=2341020 RepID=UPI0021063FF4|nr:hypothetical protein [Candidatus Nitrosotalea sp. TS]